MNHITLKDNWSVFKEKLKQKYANLTDNDLAFVLGKENEMIDQIQRKTGESRDEIEKYVREECIC
ncbi:MAG TPA: general stress protein CsbD [Opitutaceae bacterium]|nr:general stress protein CsbD [Opitutaceae bacterium]